MRGQTLGALVVIAVALSGCGDGRDVRQQADTPAAIKASVSRDVEDPAMATEPAVKVQDQSVLQVEDDVAALPTTLVVDLEERRVFLPGQGWLDESSFWHIYENQPERLPQDADLERVHELRQTMGQRALQ